MAISDWPAAERPRERLLERGAGYLTDAELVAVLLRTGIRGKNAVELARELLETLRRHHRDACRQARRREGAGSGKARPARGRARACAPGDRRRPQGRSAAHFARRRARLSAPCLGARQHEVFVCIWLDAQHRVIRFEEPFRGTLTQTSVYPREIVKSALEANAAAVIFAHNHPSGVAQPSQADELLTRSLKEALALVDIKVLDHFIIAGNQAISFAERGLV